jgi:hypothetical protein
MENGKCSNLILLEPLYLQVLGFTPIRLLDFIVRPTVELYLGVGPYFIQQAMILVILKRIPLRRIIIEMINLLISFGLLMNKN